MEKYVFGELVPFVGIVERRDADDLKIGRCKVRALHHHTADKSLLPTDKLPDAYPLESLNGGFWSTPKEGETVFGYFMDVNKQSMMILGKYPAAQQNEVKVPGGDGFKDARTGEELPSFPRQMFKSFTYGTNGVEATEMDAALPYPPHGAVASTPFLARNVEGEFPAQLSPTTRKRQAQITRFATSTGQTWFELPSAYAAVYPFNHVYESESLHSMEFDDTPGAERVTIRHRMGTGDEFFPDGSAVEKVVKDKYTVIMSDSYVGIKGTAHVHIMGDATRYIEGNLTEHIGGNYQLLVDGDFKFKIRGDETRNILGDSKASVEGDIVSKAGKTHYVNGSPLQWNSSSAPDVDTIEDFDLPDLPEDTLSLENKERIRRESTFAPNDDIDESPQEGEAGEKVVANTTPTQIECPVLERELEPLTNGDSRYRTQLSKFYQLADLSSRCIYPHHVCSQGGLTQAQVVCNLAHVAQNILDPLTEKFPGVRVNCGFRRAEAGKSQHEKGEAIDVQWPSIKSGNLSKYKEIAEWIKTNLPFDQMILEHGNTIWLHLSLKRTGSNRSQVLTMKDGSYTPGLNMFGRT
jgi:hypothetical protein